ncbi:hypothetical protein RB595_009547 [Gaeumannomyces hyphopodioides]
MSASSRGWHALGVLSRRSPRVCAQCARTRPLSSTHRTLATTTTTAGPAVETQPAPTAADVVQPPTATPAAPELPKHDKAQYRIRSGLVLTRAPILTREPTPFEASFFLYQKRLNERLVSPFFKGFFFKPDTPPMLDWDLKLKERKGIVSKEVGLYRARGVSAWADEAPLGSALADQAALRNRLAADSEMRFSDDGELVAEQDRVPAEMPLPRTTQADELNDVRRLDRALDRTLYLVVKGRDGTWQFPSDSMSTEENLHEVSAQKKKSIGSHGRAHGLYWDMLTVSTKTAARVLNQAAGVNMNTWIVGRVPIAHHVVEPVFDKDSTAVKVKGSKTFFLKGRIMAGQADITDNKLGVSDFKWLTQEELKKQLPTGYYRSIRNMLALR